VITWAVLTDPTGRRLAFQLSPEPPQFPDPRGSQQFHLEIQVGDDDVDDAERGHTFCLVWGIASGG